MKTYKIAAIVLLVFVASCSSENEKKEVLPKSTSSHSLEKKEDKSFKRYLAEASVRSRLSANECYPGDMRSCGGDGEDHSMKKCLSSRSWGPCVGLTKKERSLGFCLKGEIKSCGQGRGACSFGIQQCVPASGEYIKGKWDLSPCSGAVGPQAEVCDGIDNDCDGVIDNGLTNCDTEAHLKKIKAAKEQLNAEIAKMCTPGSARSCGSSEGQCNFGFQVCGHSGSWDDAACEGAIGPSEEVCDGLDNDCNGVIDDGLKCP